MVVDVLKQHRLRQLEERVKAGPAWKEQNLVFTNTVGGFMHPSHLYENFQVILQQAGLPHMRFHDLRHSAATILLTMGIHPKIVQELLGHSNISITLGTYSHVLPSMQKDAMEDMDDFLGEQK
jgi:integrase